MATNVLGVDAVAKAAAEKLSPTLIIGLGGTGGDILLRIRKKFFEKFGGIDEFPIVSYLWFDTDKAYKDVGAKQFAKKVDFANTEERMLTIQDTTAITGHLDQDVYRNIASWWPTGLLQTIPRLDNGAGQYRPYSRLGLYSHYAEPQLGVRQSILDALGKIHNPAAIQKVQNSEKLSRRNYAAEMDTTRRNVYIIGSLAGGTGSGMFLDIARIVRQLASDAILVGFFITSRFFPNPSQRMHANTYAALMEWDYYNDHDFLPNWSNVEDFQAIKSPVFNYSYLLDTPNSAHLALGSQPDDHKKMYETLAENVFKDFSQGSFAQAKRSARVNVSAFIGSKAIYPPLRAANMIQTEEDGQKFRQQFNRNYQSFGLASISVPHDRIITACGHKLAADLVLYWKGEGAADSNVAAINEDVNRFIPSALLDTESLLQGLDDAGANGEKASAAGSLLNQTIRFAEQTFDAARTRPVLERPDFLHNEITTFRANQLASSARGQNAGMMIRTINQNIEKIVESGTRAINTTCDHRIDVDKFSVVSTTKFVERVCEILEQVSKQCSDHLEAIRNRIQELEAEYNSRLNDLRTHVARHNLDVRKQIILDYDELRFSETVVGCGDHPDLKEEEPGLLLALRQRCLLEGGISACTSLVDAIRGKKDEKGGFRGGVVSRLQELDRTFELVAKTLRSDAAYFENKYNEDLSLVLFEPSEIDQVYYSKYVTPTTIRSVGDTARNKLQLTAASIKDTDFLKQEGGAGKIIDLCRQVFEPIRRDFHIIDVFFKRFGGSDDQYGQPVISDRMGTELNRVYSSARYWACGGTDATRNYVLEQRQEDLLVGLPDVPQDLPESDRTRIGRRREAIRDFLNTKVNPRFGFTDIPETAELIFYTELSGIPLNFWTSMYELRSTYLLARSSDTALHLESKDASKFEDMLILTDEEKARLQAAFRCLTLGAIFDEIWAKKEAARLVLGYSETVRIVDSHLRIGDDREAILFLKTRTDVTDKLWHRSETKLMGYEKQLQASDAAVVQSARKVLVAIAALTVGRMEALSANADQRNWANLPMYPKMEYIACDELNKRLHAVCTWAGFKEEVGNIKKNDLGLIGTRRADDRYALRLIDVTSA